MNQAFWLRLDRFLARLRPHRRPLSLAIDAIVIVACWNATYLFRIGFERWWSARPGYDTLVLLGVVGVYLGVFIAAGVPRGMWRFSGFGEVQRLGVACAVAGAACAVLVLMAQLSAIPRAVLALHPLVTLMGLCMVRMAYRMLYEHGRAQIGGADEAPGRALVMGAGEAARRLMAGVQQQGRWLSDLQVGDVPDSRTARLPGCRAAGQAHRKRGSRPVDGGIGRAHPRD